MSADVEDAAEMMSDSRWSERRRTGAATASRTWRHVQSSAASREVARAVAFYVAATAVVGTAWWMIAC